MKGIAVDWETEPFGFDYDPPPTGFPIRIARIDQGMRLSREIRSRAPEKRTPAQARRFKRDVVIAVSFAAGVSQRTLSEVFDLPRSRISEIVAAIRARTNPPRASE